MRYVALACDYDGTLATAGRVAEETCAALERLLASGRKLLLVTGRELEDLLEVFPQVHLFDWVVAENGALLYRPATRALTLLGSPPPHEFIHTLQARGVAPLSTGHVIVATWHPHERAVLEALREMGLSPHHVVGIGDAENDHAFLSLCGCAAAVAGALHSVKERADLITHGDNSAGVVELIDALVATDLCAYEPRLTRPHSGLGTQESGAEGRIGVQVAAPTQWRRRGPGVP